LEDAERCVLEIAEITAALNVFHAPDNMKLLCWTVCNDDEQPLAVRAALEAEVGPGVQISNNGSEEAS
jgi:hypothetical protein